MNIGNIDRALFAGLFVATIIFISEFFFPETNSFISILIGALAALFGYLIGDKLFLKEKEEK
ncbi:hypothetical protein [Gracilibacillus salinarum]|uniref:Uncharacterized protein n=1 Tax=Gracilibacillus salinarum TaxID=2932255 RepID=A0ABY4GGT9_9BACI|nr:hypothetical protein [Gracilibacillus salinarum]UOQ83543.1 hypothetical protein MUN87_12325 [Gracilibacillus salinarum]